ncbi:MAG: hypothetical protein ABFD24_11730 [Anaerolineaceae bacterium]
MPQTGSMIGFIILVVLVVIGVILYAYLTVMNQKKDEGKEVLETVEGILPKYHLAADLETFVREVQADHPVETLLPLKEIQAAKGRLHETRGLSAARIDTNLIAECTRCGRRIASREMDQIDQQVCPTPNCKSDEYLLRWLPGNGFVEAAPPAGE